MQAVIFGMIHVNLFFTGGLLFVVNGPEFLGGGHVSGFIISLASKRLIETFIPNGLGFNNPHDVAVNTDGSQVYVVELDPYKVWKFVKGKEQNVVMR
jgi:DNA-binding beta-propeller fold protein YncE